MTSRADEIQKLIADIDNLLTNNGKRLPKLLSAQAPEAKEVLERVRNFLVKLKETEESQGNISQPTGKIQPSPLLTKFAEQVNPPSDQQQPEPTENAVTSSQLKSELATLIQPLQAELTALLQERSTLMQEIRLLEQKRLQNYSISQQLANQEQIIGEFLQVLMGRLVPTVAPHIKENAAQDTPVASTFNYSSPELTPSSIPYSLESSAQVERLSQFAKELDQRLLSLDGTLNFVFEALQRNINTYHESLSQALAKMHSTGLQGEQLMVSFLNNLTQHLQQQTSIIQSEAVGVARETPPRSLFPTKDNTTTLESIKPANKTPEIATSSVELPELGLEPVPVNNPPEDVAANDLDAMLLELTGNSPQPENTPEPAIELEFADLELGIGNWQNLEQPSSEAFFMESPSVSSEVAIPSQKASTNLLDSLPPPIELPEDSELTDEVDQLYASLFTITPIPEPSVDVTPTEQTEDFFTLNTSDTQSSTPFLEEQEQTADLFAVDPSDVAQTQTSNVVPPDNTVQESSLFTPNAEDEPHSVTEKLPTTEPGNQVDNIFTQSDAGLLELGNLHPQQPTVSSQFPDLSSDFQQELFFEEESTLPATTLSYSRADTDKISLQPSHTDTISSLTELFAEVSSEEQLWPGLSPSEILVTLDEPSPDAAIKAETHEHFSDTYIAALPQENLLSPEIIQSANVPEISFNEEQLQQLNQDLANFDELLNYQPPLEPNLYSLEDSQEAQNVAVPNPQTIDNAPNVAFSRPAVPPVAPISLPQTEVDLNFSPTNEKKKEVTVTGSGAENQLENPIDVDDSVWYLGIDLGTTGISAALLNRSQSVVYPIYWSAENIPGATSFQQHSFRLPAEVYLPTATSTQAKAAQQKISPYSAQLKPYLQVAIPYKSEQQKWEPVLQFNEFSAGPLIWVVRSLSKLLLTLKSDRQSTTQGLVATAVGIDQPAFHTIINKIAGVICTSPSGWPEQYRFNVREALLTSKIIQHPQQVFFIEEAIASLISLFDQSNGEIIQVSDRDGLQPVKTTESLLGSTLVINIGATATEMALVDIPENLLQLAHHDFMLHSFAYASKGIEQDIICQLLIPPKYRQPRTTNQEDSSSNTSNLWHWQPTFLEVDKMQWQSLELDNLDLPRAGEADLGVRIRLQQRLESSLLGQALLEAALALKLILQHQETFTLTLADQRWVLQRRDLENQVFIPFVRRLNRELNKLLVARGIPTEAINQAVLTGGVASLGVVHHWLRQKFPNAKLIQDAYLGENGAPNCSRVAYGLAMLPLHSQILEESRQQYTDYFLFTELLRLLPERTLSFNEVLQLFEARGINTSICQQRLLAFLEGELPPGLIPSLPESAWLTQNSHDNLDYQAIASAPLFEKQGNLTYRPNCQQLLVLRRYLEAVKASTQQSLEEPYIVNFAQVQASAK
ncbi:hypothetical protein H6G76_24950 [Nostoc sp. FACHB-152]|uniref:hypothetical protein n=1 Tax=unclassified Nostoc TaxID=2593658 RepID=UPI001685C04D|nr:MULTISPECIES: hypothetical protein [unclassified Nostoc]MBD2450348.1 hypothetical protein [Nostoc sp. FACHB-152]MBD2471748.1 hypothetical protein [Nostoc sp. FACHB-145]